MIYYFQDNIWSINWKMQQEKMMIWWKKLKHWNKCLFKQHHLNLENWKEIHHWRVQTFGFQWVSFFRVIFQWLGFVIDGWYLMTTCGWKFCVLFEIGNSIDQNIHSNFTQANYFERKFSTIWFEFLPFLPLLDSRIWLGLGDTQTPESAL